jgi:2-(1,2-epoxy-1,2-dihydrophenyl)acetyl-CoA isomerase
MTYKEILVNKENHITKIYFNRDETRNAISDLTIEEFTNALIEADEDRDTRVIIVGGKGKSFSAGGDIKAMQSQTGMFAGEANELRLKYKFGIQKIPHVFEHLSTPVIAMVNGAAIGAGLDICCMCDFRIASSNAKFGETFVKLALIPGDGGCYFLQRVVGYAKAMEMTLTGDIYSAQEALTMGLVSKIVEQDDLEKVTLEFANKISLNPPVAVQMAKKAIVHASKNDLNSTLDLLAAYQAITQKSQDHLSAVNGFIKKEKTKFTGL